MLITNNVKNMINKGRVYFPPLHWWYFSKKVKHGGKKLLTEINKFEHPILVTGCQRSGTTVLRRAISQSEEMSEFWSEKDDELEGAIILSGGKRFVGEGRFCFQTTYLNEFYKEYLDIKVPFKMIWVLRDPESVIKSMLFNWKRFPLNELFLACGIDELPQKEMRSYKKYGIYGVSPVVRGCCSYIGKLKQLSELSKKIDKDQLYVVDYNDILENRSILKNIYDFVNLEYEESYSKIFKSSEKRKINILTENQKKIIASMCNAQYLNSLSLVNDA
jgi:hypothetical protein